MKIRECLLRAFVKGIRMHLKDLGFDSWFENKAKEILEPDCVPARVISVSRDAYQILNERGECAARLAGRIRFGARSSMDFPCVGDWVGVQYHNSGASAVIQALLPRKTFLRRKCAGKDVDFQMIAANMDIAFIVQAFRTDFNLRRLDRYLVMVNEGHVSPVFILNKSDLVPPDEHESILEEIRQSGIRVSTLAISAVTGAGLHEFRQFVKPGYTYCLLGSSGVGKSTLINRLIGRELLTTREVSGTGEGRHATASRQLHVLDQGAMLIDTPGMRELGLLGAEDGFGASFEDIRILADLCRYKDCRHISEPGCAVLAAVQDGTLDESRYRNYQKLMKESAFHEMTYEEKRKKDKAFGRFIHSAMKQMKK